MKKTILISILFCSLAYGNNFLNPYEYGEALYKNPRGIGCIKCHGAHGEGMVISHIKQNGKLKPITAPKISGIAFDKFEEALKLGKGYMPKYNLSVSEIVSLYIFLNPQVEVKKEE